MCAEFMIRGDVQKSLRQQGLPVRNLGEDSLFDKRVKLYTSAPVVFQQDSSLVMEKMSFSLRPKGTPFPSFNARLESWDEKKHRVVPIFEKPTWKKPFKSNRCLIPLSCFIEPIYVGDYAGMMLRFFASDDKVLLAAGIYERTVDRATGEEYLGFSMIIDAPSEFVFKTGHHRQPLLLQSSAHEEWLQEDEIEPQWGLNFLKRHKLQTEFKVEIDRPMAKGWEKRVQAYIEKADRELEFLENKMRLGSGQ